MDTSPSPVETARIDRVSGPDVLAVLERLNASEAVSSGSVNIIGLESIREQLAQRWPAKRSRVWEHVERDLQRRLTAYDASFRLDEVTYLIAMPSTTRFIAQAACLAIVQDVLKFFLGESQVRDIKVRVVSSVSDGQIISDAVDPMAILEAAAKMAGALLSDETHTEPEWKPPLAGRTHSATFLTEVRRTAEVKMGVEGVWNLRRGLITSFALQRVVRPQLSRAADLVRADCAVMAYAADLLQEHRELGGRLTLHLPLSYSSAAHRQTREKVLTVLAPVRDLLRATILFEIADLDPGVPPSRMIEVVALLKPFCMGVLARVRPTRAAMAAVRSCGLQGVVLDMHDLGGAQADVGLLMRSFVELARGAAPNILVHNLGSRQLVDVALRAGMTHASVRPALAFETEIDAA